MEQKNGENPTFPCEKQKIEKAIKNTCKNRVISFVKLLQKKTYYDIII